MEYIIYSILIVTIILRYGCILIILKRSQQKYDIVHSKRDRRAYNAVVIFKDMEESQMKNI